MPIFLQLDARDPDPVAVARLAASLRAGELAALPTDTVYGLAANALDPAAVRRARAAKGRDETKAFPVFVSGVDQARQLAEWPALADELARRFWPGALTLIVPARPGSPPDLLAGGATIALRRPDSPLIAALLLACGFPLTGTSANRSGQPPAVTGADVAAQLGDSVAFIVDSNALSGAVSNSAAASAVAGADVPGASRASSSTPPSTILDLTCVPPRVARLGAIPLSALAPWLEFGG